MDPQIVRQHIGWLKVYCQTATSENWRDNLLHAERQLDRLSEEIFKPPPRDVAPDHSPSTFEQD